MPHDVHLVTVFAAAPGGGNPAPIVLDAGGMSDVQMQAVARSHGFESGFVLPAPAGSCCDFEFRFWVPNHEMPMCGHATVGAVWLLDRFGMLPRDRLTIRTRSGRVRARVNREGGGTRVEVSQPAGRVAALPEPERSRAEILDVLGIGAEALAPFPIRNGCTSRVKTLVPLADCAVLDALVPDFARVEALCTRIGSTGLYPYAPVDPARAIFAARQFPRSSGYPEDAATGIAAAALAFGLREVGQVAADRSGITVHQGRAMGRPSEITVRFQPGQGRARGCWIGGPVRMEVGQ